MFPAHHPDTKERWDSNPQRLDPEHSVVAIRPHHLFGRTEIAVSTVGFEPETCSLRDPLVSLRDHSESAAWSVIPFRIICSFKIQYEM